MKTLLTLTISLLFSIFSKTFACDCIFISTFCESIKDENGQLYSYLSIHRVKVLSKVSDGLNVVVEETYAGNNLAGQMVFIKDGNGADCGLFASLFLDVDVTYIIAAYEEMASLMLSECHVSYLKVENDEVIGPIAPGIEQAPLSQFSEVMACSSLNTTSEPLRQISIHPSLTSSFVYITATPNLNPSDFHLLVYDATGRLLMKTHHARFGSNEPLAVDVSALPAGLYFFKIEMGNSSMLTRKIVKTAVRF